MQHDQKTILLAENEAIYAAYLVHLLKESGWSAEVVKDGQQVLEKINQKQYAFILMNSYLPLLDGLETARRIRKSEEETHMHIPIVGVTRYSLEGEKKRLLSAGMDFCLSQPVYKNDLNQILDNIKKATKSNISAA